MRPLIFVLLGLALAACNTSAPPNPVNEQVNVDELNLGIEGADLEDPSVPGQ